MSFDRIAPYYSLLERVCAGSLMQRCRTAHMAEIVGARNILIAGEGTGRFLAACVEAYPQAEITVLDASQGMLQRAEKSWAKHGRGGTASFINADIREWQPPEARFDVIVTHYFLDCFSGEELPAVIAKLALSAADNARWLVADFREPEKGMQRLRARWILRAAYAFFNVSAGLKTRTLTSPDALLAKNGFHLEKRKLFDWGLMLSDLWSRRARL